LPARPARADVPLRFSPGLVATNRLVVGFVLALGLVPAPVMAVDILDAGRQDSRVSLGAPEDAAEPKPPSPKDDSDRAGRATADRERTRSRDGEPGSDARAGSRSRSREGETARRAAAKKDPCGEASKACRDALQLLRDDDIASIDLDIRVGGRAGNDYPCECRLEGETFEPRRFASTTITWKAAGYCHKPLYFEDWDLERYGHSRGLLLDPFISGAHFFTTLPILPYKAGMQAPWECVYPLGYYRPGSCAPWTIPGVPYSPRGFAVQAATVTGIVFLLP
jgi:hypothetical protein